MTDSPLLPQDLDAEKAVLGAMMMNPAALQDAMAVLGAGEALYVPQHRILYDVLTGLTDADKPIDLIVACDELRRQGKFDQVGGQEYMILLAESFGDWGNAEHYARVVVEKYHLRCLFGIGAELRARACNPTSTSETVAEYAQEALERIGDGPSDGPGDLHDTIVDLPSVGTTQYIPTQLEPLDREIGGVEIGAVWVLAARPSVGKTSLAVQIAAACAQGGGKVLFVSLEMRKSAIAWRFTHQISGRSSTDFQHRMSPDEIQEAIALTARAIVRDRVFIEDKMSRVREIAAHAKAMHRKHGLSMVVVDYLQLCSTTERSENRNLEVASMSKVFKGLAQTTGLPVVLLSQLNRGDDEKPPQLKNLRDSGAIEQDADVVILLHREPVKESERTMTDTIYLCVRKNRNGKTLPIETRFHRPSMKFSPVPAEPVPF